VEKEKGGKKGKDPILERKNRQAVSSLYPPRFISGEAQRVGKDERGGGKKGGGNTPKKGERR